MRANTLKFRIQLNPRMHWCVGHGDLLLTSCALCAHTSDLIHCALCAHITIPGVTPEMSDRLEAAAKAIEERNEAIREAYRQGNSLRDIATKVGMSWSGVRKIINQEEPQK
jgi:hypothetical protein